MLLEKGIFTYNLIVEKYFKHLIGNHRLLPLYMGVYEELYPRALDNDHLGQAGHKAFAIDLMNTIGVDHALVNNSKPYSIFKQLKNIICK